jgi:hypothetical protein
MRMVIPVETRPLLSAATAELVFANSMLTNAIFADRRIAACVYYSTWTNPILSRTLRQQKMRLSDEERNACLDCSKKEKAPRTPPSQGRFLSSPPPESLPDGICIHVIADKALEHRRAASAKKQLRYSCGDLRAGDAERLIVESDHYAHNLVSGE